jgi:hypothetical protein
MNLMDPLIDGVSSIDLRIANGKKQMKFYGTP